MFKINILRTYMNILTNYVPCMLRDFKPRFELPTEPDSVKDGKDKDVTRIMFPLIFDPQNGNTSPLY